MPDEASAEQVVRTLDEYLRVVLAFAPPSKRTLLLRGCAQGSWELRHMLAHALDRRRDLLTERQLVKRHCLPHLTRGLDHDNQWDVLALTHHHGVPTRLLDWNENPLTGLWFNVSSDEQRQIRPECPSCPHEAEPGKVRDVAPDDDGYVADNGERWRHADATSSNACVHYKVDTTLFFQPSDVAARIVEQNGWFSVHGWNASLKTSPFGDLGAVSRTKNRLKYVVIPRDAFHGLRVALDLTGATSAALCPDLDGLCKQPKWTHTLPAAPACVLGPNRSKTSRPTGGPRRCLNPTRSSRSSRRSTLATSMRCAVLS